MTDKPEAPPEIGTIVLYRLNPNDAEAINRRYSHATANREAMRADQTGYQAHVGNLVHAGEIYPMIIIRAWSATCVNGKIFLDGSDDFWATSVTLGEGIGTWNYQV